MAQSEARIVLRSDGLLNAATTAHHLADVRAVVRCAVAAE